MTDTFWEQGLVRIRWPFIRGLFSTQTVPLEGAWPDFTGTAITQYSTLTLVVQCLL